ncbi:ABC transporter ATP-binding protein [Celerinatantimonas yamalensis]|uniref:ABC transporter ATP-binding protein n=1 Tax=Celerinatantimonas yamalensis TaxID=559956 RepID=A0ABW9G5M2_9GAMM
MQLLKVIRALLQMVSYRRVGLLLMLMVLTGITEGFGVLLLVPLLQSLQTNEVSEQPQLIEKLANFGLHFSLTTLMGTVLFLIVVRVILQYFREQMSATMQYQLVDTMRLKNFSLLLNTEWKWLAMQSQAEQANSLLTDINRVGMGFHFTLGLLASMVTMVAYLVVAFSLSWPITLLAFISGGAMLWVLSGQRKRALSLGHQLGEANQAMQSNVQQSLAGIKLAKILGREHAFVERFKTIMGTLRQQQLNFQIDTSLAKGLFQIGGAMLLIIYLFVGLELWHLHIAQLLTLVIIFSRMIPLFMSAQQQLHHCLHALPAFTQAQHLQALYQRYGEPTAPRDSAMVSLHRAITFENVSFRYDEENQDALKHISITLRARTTTAIIGHSGAGKSTLADLLMGLLESSNGLIRVDDTELTGNFRHSWRRSVAYVPQDIFLFNDTIRNNLLWGNPSASEDDLLDALKLAAAEFVVQLPAQLDTQVGDGGVRLSGGERQRIVLARALLKRPALLILDEATSALDMENESRIREAIENLHGHLTLVVIGHRLPTLEHADQVIKLANGQVIAQGSWQSLRQPQSSCE